MAYAAAIIGGTGIGEKLLSNSGDEVRVETRLGSFLGVTTTFGSKAVLVVQRHGGGHKLPPHRVPYAAMALALAELQIPVCFSTAAVGSLHPAWRVGTMAACTDTIDVSARNLTLFDDDVRHTDFTHPFPAARHLVSASEKLGVSIEPEAVYVNVNGPRYESPAEIRAYRGMGGDVVGMTAGTEAVVMAEAKVPYACLAIVTNLAAGMGASGLDHGDVGQAMTQVSDLAISVLEMAVRNL